MRLKSEEFVRGQYYHLYNHAVTEQLMFRDEEDYLHCLSNIKRFYNQEDYSILAYCLMPNHYHFLVYQKTDYPVYRYFEQIWNKYSRYYNNKYSRKGTLFAGKLQHCGVSKVEYLLRLCAYIHLNPVKAKLATHPEDWQWSNYPEWIGQRNGTLIDKEQVSVFFRTDKEYLECINCLLLGNLDKTMLLDSQVEKES